MKKDPRLPLNQVLEEQLKELVRLRKARGCSATLTSVGSEILSSCIPRYIQEEQSIIAGQLPGCDNELHPSPATIPSSGPKAIPLNPIKNLSKRDLMSSFLSS